MDDRYAINAAMTEIREGYRMGDVERILAVYQTGFSDLSDGFPSFGREESKIVLEERLLQLFARYEVEFVPVSMFIHVLGAQAVDCGWHEFRLRSKQNGTTTSHRSRYVEVWHRTEEGRWAIALFIDNRDQMPTLVENMLERLRAAEYEPAESCGHRMPNSTQSL